jgi:O-antigen ligase
MKNFIEKINLSRHFDNADAEENVSTAGSVIFFLLTAMMVFSVVAFGAVDAWAFGVLSVCASAIVVLWLVDSWKKKEFRFNSSALQLPLFGLILIGLVQLLPLRGLADAGELLSVPTVSALSLDPYLTRLFLIRLFVYIVFFAAALTFINSQKRLRQMVLTIIIFGAVMAFVGILQRLASPDAIYGVRLTPQAIPFASFVNQHHFAAFMNMTIGLTFGLLFGKATKKDKKPLLLIAAFLMLLTVIFTGSRGGFLSFLAISGVFLLPKLLFRKSAVETEENLEPKGFQNKLVIISGILTVGILLVGTILFLGGDQSLLRGIGLQENQADISNGRLHFWYIAVQIFFDYPILGAGLDAFGAAFSRYDTWNGMWRVEQAHNDYLQILADAGLAGFVCVAAFIYLLFKKSLPNVNDYSDSFRRSVAMGALAGCFGILIHSFFDFPLRTPSNGFFFLTLAALATILIGEKKRKIKSKE